MAASDFMALNNNFAQWQKTRGQGLTGISPFNYYAIENFLKAFPVNDKEIMSGAVDQSKDGGVDAFYFFANRKYVFEDTKLDAEAEWKFHLVIFQNKEGSGFSPIEMGKFVFFADDLLDPNRVETDYTNVYHSKLKKLMRIFKDQYFQVAGSVTQIEIDVNYITKLDVEQPKPDSDVIAYEAKLRAAIAAHFPKAILRINYINAERLLAQAQLRKRNEKDLVWDDQIVTPEGWITLVTLPEFYKFIQDTDGSFHEQMLEENVRGFQKKTPVNEGIAKTLREPADKAEFWLLNNGVTVLTEAISPAPKSTIKIKDPQIVNGLQTSRHIYDYYKGGIGIPPDDKRRIIVRIIETTNDDVRDQIINATNSQNKMPPEALRATEQIQMKIEEVFLSFGWFYDRRKGHHKDKGMPAAKIVSVREVLQATLAIMLRLPDQARGRPGDYLSDDPKYKQVYLDEKAPLTVHVRGVEIMRRIEGYKAKPEHSDCFLDLQFYVGLILAARSLKNAYIPAPMLAGLNVAGIDDAEIGKAFEQAYAAYNKFGGDAIAAKSVNMRNHVIAQLEAELHG